MVQLHPELVKRETHARYSLYKFSSYSSYGSLILSELRQATNRPYFGNDRCDPCVKIGTLVTENVKTCRFEKMGILIGTVVYEDNGLRRYASDNVPRFALEFVLNRLYYCRVLAKGSLRLINLHGDHHQGLIDDRTFQDNSGEIVDRGKQMARVPFFTSTMTGILGYFVTARTEGRLNTTHERLIEVFSRNIELFEHQLHDTTRWKPKRQLHLWQPIPQANVVSEPSFDSLFADVAFVDEISSLFQQPKMSKAVASAHLEKFEALRKLLFNNIRIMSKFPIVDITKDDEFNSNHQNICELLAVGFPVHEVDTEQCRWLSDTCASRHVFKDVGAFKTFRPRSSQTIGANQDAPFSVFGCGDVEIPFHDRNGQETVIRIKDVDYSPQCTANLISTRCFCAEHGLKYAGDEHEITFEDKQTGEEKAYGFASASSKMYTFRANQIEKSGPTLDVWANFHQVLPSLYTLEELEAAYEALEKVAVTNHVLLASQLAENSIWKPRT